MALVSMKEREISIKDLMKKLWVGFLVYLFASLAYAANEGSVTGMKDVKSQLSFEQTVSNLETVLQNKGMTVFNRIEHSKAAEKVGISLNKTVLIIFGNPKAGSLLMQCSPSVALDLPLKVMVRQNNAQEVWVAYNSLSYLKHRHSIEGCDVLLNKMDKGLTQIIGASIQ